MARYGMLINTKKCVGCYACRIACQMKNHLEPDEAFISYRELEQGTYPNVYAEVVEKCRFCWEDGEPGNPPACVGTCISGTRIFGDLDDPESEISREIARTNAQPIAGDLTKAKIFYVR